MIKQKLVVHKQLLLTTIDVHVKTCHVSHYKMFEMFYSSNMHMVTSNVYFGTVHTHCLLT